MARLQTLCPVGIPPHLIQRGNNRQIFIASDEDITAIYTAYMRPRLSIG